MRNPDRWRKTGRAGLQNRSGKTVAALSVEKVFAAERRTEVQPISKDTLLPHLSGPDGQREELQVGHGKMRSIVAEERYFVAQGNGGNGHVGVRIGVRKRLAFLLPSRGARVPRYPRFPV
jgi:hypothetical protein